MRKKKCIAGCSNIVSSDSNQSQIETRKCHQPTCPQIGEWANWSECSVSCGEGEKTRTRICSPSCYFLLKYVFKYAEIPTEKKTCHQSACPVFGEWANWSKCSVSCGYGEKTRSRFCTAGCSKIAPRGSHLSPTERKNCHQSECLGR